MQNFTQAALTTLMIGTVALIMFWMNRRRMRLPPGPRRFPVIGSLLSMPENFEWKTYHQWAKQLGACPCYGKHPMMTLCLTESDIVYCDAFGVSVVILDSLKAATDLLDKRSSIYSSRWVPK